MAADYVYWNLHKHVYSIMNRGVVRDYGEHVLVRPYDGSVDFVVRAAGRERVLHEGRKNVHAFVRGEANPVHVNVYGGLHRGSLASMERADERFGEAVEVSYRPTEGDSFYVVATGQPVTSAELVYLRSSPAYGRTGVYAWGVR